MTAPQTDATTDPHTIIAALQQRLDAALARETALAGQLGARTAELAQRNTDYSERIEHQTATVDVLKAMSASPGDTQPIFDLITRRARELCNGANVGLWEFGGELVHASSVSSLFDPSPVMSRYPMRPNRATIAGRTILEGQIIHIRDADSDPELLDEIRSTTKSILGLPLLREGTVIGSITLNALESGGFSDSQIALLQTFAEQAVIAITSAETYRGLHEALEQQTATAEVLQVINAKPGDLAPVFDAMLERALRLGEAAFGTIRTFDGKLFHLAASRGASPALLDFQRKPLQPGPGAARMLRGEDVIHTPNVIEGEAYKSGAPAQKALAELAGARSHLSVALRSEHGLLGYMSFYRQEVRPFTDKQVALLQNFAAQAVVAMENARLITEQREALEKQTATAEVLQVINASPGNLAPVYDAMLEKAMHLCGAVFGSLTAWDGKYANVLAMRGYPPALAQYMAARGPRATIPPVIAQLAETRRPQQVADVVAGEGYRNGHPVSRAVADLGGARTILHVPLRKDEAMVGYISVYRQEVRAFTDKQIALLENFAAQAVIAMENARLITEQREALEQQTATAEVLGVINASPGNLAPVFDAMLEKALRLCDAAFGNLWTYDGEVGRLAAICGASPEYRAELMRAGPQKPEPGGSLIRLVEGEPLVHIADITAEGAHRSGAAVRRMLADRAGARTVLWVPMRKDRVLLGFFTIYRTEVRPFTDKQIALLDNFAAQAVIAMENARLINEQREALEQQTATAEVLQVINASPGDLVPVFNAILEKAHGLCDVTHGVLVLREGEIFRAVATHSYSGSFAEALRQGYRGADNPLTRALINGERFVHIPDLAQIDHPMVRASVENAGVRTGLFLPLRKDGVLLGMISSCRKEIRPFSDKEIALLENFAAQAVIAMENARLLTETREALEQQTATAEVLQVINASPGDLTPVFDTLLERALHLCQSAFGILSTYDGEFFHNVAFRGVTPELAEFLRRPFLPVPGSGLHKVFEGEDMLHTPDIVDDDAYRRGIPARRALADLGGARTQLLVALRKDGVLLGVLNIFRREVRPFTDKQIALLQNFAAQAVIAMENARLLTEQREALEQQTATAEVLQVINASPGDLAPVFDAMLEKALRLSGSAFGLLRDFDGKQVRTIATRGLPEALAVFSGQTPLTPEPGGALDVALKTGQPAEDLDLRETDVYKSGIPGPRAMVDLGGARTVLQVPLVKDRNSVGLFTFYRQEVRSFSPKEIALLENFAAQAVIAMENARLLGELRERTEALAQRNSEFGERIEQQAATIDVLKVMSESPDDTQPVFDLITRRAAELCEARAGLWEFDGTLMHFRAGHGTDPETQAAFARQFPRPPDSGTVAGRSILGRRVIHIPNIATDLDISQAARDLGGTAIVAIPLLRDAQAIGAIALNGRLPAGFSDNQIQLLQTFGEQAAIAISSVATFRALRDRTEELTRSVRELQALEEVLRAVNSSLDVDTVLATIINRAVQLSRADEGTIYEFNEAEEVFVPKAAFGMTAERVEALRDRRIRIGETPLGNSAAMRAPLHIPDLTRAPSDAGAPELVEAGIHALLAVPLLREDRIVGGLVIRRRAAGGFAPTIPALLQTFAVQSVLAIENARLFQEAGRARTAAEAALVDLRRAQDRLVQSEKMASLGQLTAGIAHEIKNPLNFVNNFSALSTELIDELRDVLAPEPLGETARTEVDDLTALLKGNLEKVVQHGQRADGIVRSMLDHSRGSSGERRMVDLNTLIDEALNLAYHGARAQDQSFNITLERDFGEGISPIEVNPQDITRVFLNLFSNGFYATTKRARSDGDAAFVPTLKVTTRDADDVVEIRVRDNGTGIPADIRDKLFQPFFTTKPTGEGTGLGLSITYDIVTQQHGGSIAVDSKVGDYSEFTIRLPRGILASEGGRA